MTVVDSISNSTDAIFSAVSDYAASHHDGLVALSLFAGVIIAFSGRTLLRPTVFLIGFVPTIVTIIAIGLAFVDDETEPRPHDSILKGIVVTIAVCMGIAVGIVMLRLLFRIVTFMLCAGFGAVIVFVFHLFLLEPASGPNAVFLLYSAIVFAALIAGLFSVSYPETGIILGTSFDGAALSVYCLARFLGHRPKLLAGTIEGTDSSAWWSMGYGAATLCLGVFGALTQRQVAVADSIVAQSNEQKRSSEQPSPELIPSGPLLLTQGEQDHLLSLAEPPHTPPYMRSGVESPAGSGYGAVDHEDSQYSVVHNLGAAPLGPAVESYPNKNGKESNGPLPL